MCHIPKAVYMMVDANAANGDSVVRSSQVRKSENSVIKKKTQKKPEKREKEKKEGKR